MFPAVAHQVYDFLFSIILHLASQPAHSVRSLPTSVHGMGTHSGAIHLAYVTLRTAATHIISCICSTALSQLFSIYSRTHPLPFLWGHISGLLSGTLQTFSFCLYTVLSTSFLSPRLHHPVSGLSSY